LRLRHRNSAYTTSGIAVFKLNIMPNHENGLQKSLNLLDATALVVGSMIGSGIFIVSADIARQLGSPGWLMVSWIIAGLLTVMAAASYGELASMMPDAGGQYVYLREAYNPLVGFLYGWTSFTVIQAGSIAAVAMAFAKFLGVMVPWISEEKVLFRMGPLAVHTAHLTAIASILFLTWINTRGIRTGKYIQNFFTYTKTLVLFGFIVAGLFFAHRAEVIQANLAVFWDAVRLEGGRIVPLSGFALMAALGVSMVGSLFTYDAWYNVTFTSRETIDPRRNIPRSLILGTFLTTAIYILVNAVYLMTLPLRGTEHGATVFERGIQFAVSDRVGTASLSGIFGDSSVVLMALLIVVATFGCNNGLILSGARVYYAMARDGLFFQRAGRLNRQSVPGNALVYQGIWSCLLCLSGNYSQILDYVITAVLIFFILTIAAVFVLRIRRPDAPRAFRAFGFPYVQLLYGLATLFIIVTLLIEKPHFTWPGLLIVLLGIPVYFIWQKCRRWKGKR